MLKEYPLATILSAVAIIVGFIIPIVFLLGLIPEIYLVTREEPDVKRTASFLIGATIILFVVMFFVWGFING